MSTAGSAAKTVAAPSAVETSAATPSMLASRQLGAELVHHRLDALARRGR